MDRWNTTPLRDCLPVAEWEEVVAGLCRPAHAAAALHHAVSCTTCGAILRRLAEEAATDPDVPAAELRRLTSSQPRAQRRLARRLLLLQRRFLPDRGHPHRRAAYCILGAAFALASLALAAWWVPFRGRAFLAEHLVERAYSQRRSLPLRLEGAAYAPLITPMRGATASTSAALLEAEGLAEAGLDEHPADPVFLHIQARADLVQGEAAPAIADLRRALIAQPRSAGILIDLGSAYYLSAAGGNDPAYAQALDYLGQALALQPHDPVAVFNRGVVEEAMQDWTGAVSDWSEYLTVDSQGDWAKEARRHLTADQQLVHRHDAEVAAPLLAPGQFGQLGPVSSNVDARIEDYLRAATVTWLPAAYPVAGPPDPASRAGLQVLAELLRRGHHDVWLDQMLVGAERDPNNAALARGLVELATAVDANAAGRPDAALASARSAEAAFTAAHVSAGAARAAFEEVYALHRREQGDACIAALHRWLAPGAIAGDGWIIGEAALEEVNCAGMARGQALDAAIFRAVAVASADHYPMLRMRAESFAAAIPTDPSSEVTWRNSREQLALYWQERVGAYRAYQLEMQLAFNAGYQRQWFAAERLARAAVERIALTPERSYEAMARQQWADYAAACGFDTEAQEQRARAAELFNQLPDSATTANLRAYNQLAVAELAMEQGDAKGAQAALERYRREQPPVVSLAARTLPYFALRGRLELAQGDAAAAERDERAAIAVSESFLRSATGDEERLDWRNRNRDAYRAWVEIEWRLHQDPLAALEFWEWARGAQVRTAQPVPASFLASARAFDSSGAPPLPEPSLVRTTLPALHGEQIISYALYPQALAIWIYDDRGVHGVWMPEASVQLETEAHAFATACADPGSDSRLLAVEAQRLYSVLLQPVAQWLDPQRVLLVEADGALSEVPFAALQDPSGRYLVQPVVQSPGLMYAVLAHDGASPLREERLLAVADPAASSMADGSALPALPDTRAEVAEAEAVFSPASLVLTGPAATPQAVLAALPQSQVFHFAGHAEAGDLLLASGGSLNAAELTPAVLRQCRLAVLAACATAGAHGLQDAEGLVHAFLCAGTSRVVATRWPVDSATSSVLCLSFYDDLRRGESVADALHHAQLQLRHTPATAAPFYWAGFAVYGAKPDPRN